MFRTNVLRTNVWGDIMYNNKTKKRRYRVVNKLRFFTFISFFITIIIYVIIISAGSNKVYSSIYEDKYVEVKVEKGDTLWDIAKRYVPKDCDIRKLVFELREFNEMEDVNIHPGDVIKIPTNTYKIGNGK
ncbi:hypothetical protein C3E88_01660 [Clostridium sp. Cult3]|nr:hypothetical protein [Clostridium sp. Cult3]